jgi:TPR repeat protein
VAAAIYWYTKAAEAGDAPAMTLLGDVYRYGRQGTVDYARALSWYMKAADMGYGPAQYNLGQMYECGQGVPVDTAMAAYWFELSGKITGEVK